MSSNEIPRPGTYCVDSASSRNDPCRDAELLNRKIVEQGGKCVICPKKFIDYDEIVPDHMYPKGMGGASAILTTSKQSIGCAIPTKD